MDKIINAPSRIRPLNTALTTSLQLSSLLTQFNGPCPRYTSYPTIDQYQVLSPKQALYIVQQAITHRVSNRQSRPLALYVHIPFCRKQCYYCACNKIITQNQRQATNYLNTLKTEIDMWHRALGAQEQTLNPITAQLYLGGGTPTFFTDEQLSCLLQILKFHFPFLPNAECSIEIDPRTVNYERLIAIRTMGFNRISFGIQDFNPEVQQAIGREQSFTAIHQLVQLAKALQFQSINFDLIHGLPLQTPQSFRTTLRQVVQLQPNRIALYAYAHMPERFKAQRLIAPSQLPNATERTNLLAIAIEDLQNAGYEYIGMDHFALPNDALAQAKRLGRLHRNFQGYTTLPADLIGFGASSISQIGPVMMQNQKGVVAYQQHIQQHQWAVHRGHIMSAEDQQRRAIIMAIMCQGGLRYSDINETYLCNMQSQFETELTRLQPFIDMGLVHSHADGFELTSAAWFVVRNIAQCFDANAMHPS